MKYPYFYNPPQGAVTFSKDNVVDQNNNWPLAAGDYVAILINYQSYYNISNPVPFTVTPTGTTSGPTNFPPSTANPKKSPAVNYNNNAANIINMIIIVVTSMYITAFTD
jgi:hypothetical protein